MIIERYTMPDTFHPDNSSLEDARWTALNDRSATAAFFYGVTSTGVVCRPACPSRRPRRDRTRFFDTLEQAFAAGFRACQRCRPGAVAPQAELAARIELARLFLEERIEEGPVSLAMLANVAGVSPFHLQRSFRQALGVSPAEYGRRLRAERFSRALAEGRQNVTGAMYTAGFQSASRVYAKTNSLGMAPGALRRKGEHEVIRYSVSDSPLGRMLVAATARGVCSIAFGDTDAELEAELRGRFAAAELLPDDTALAEAVGAVLDTLQESPGAVALPMDVRATAFQQRVWKALQAIPRGETRTYTQVAVSIGQPTAARAVARACATNPAAVVVPCHRVVGADGSLTGYRWGRERKRKLLDMESASTKARC